MTGLFPFLYGFWDRKGDPLAALSLPRKYSK